MNYDHAAGLSTKQEWGGRQRVGGAQDGTDSSLDPFAGRGCAELRLSAASPSAWNKVAVGAFYGKFIGPSALIVPLSLYVNNNKSPARAGTGPMYLCIRGPACTPALVPFPLPAGEASRKCVAGCRHESVQDQPPLGN